MSKLLSDLRFYVEESNIGFVPWKSVLQDLTSSDLGADDDDKISSSSRPFHYLKSLKGLPKYAEDFGFQWTQLYDDYRKDRYKHLEQFLRLGINPEV